jgi:hypothetical protein
MMLMKESGNNLTVNNMEETIDFEKTIRKDGVTKRICISKCENGYIISISKYGEIEGKYIDECKKYISKTNPLKKDDDEIVSIKDFLSEV